jgi:pimeloyl-ACP methyl ester carboxylesterase
VVRRESRQLGGRTASWLDAGDPTEGNVLVWLHAFPLSGAMWRSQLEALPAGWRMIAPDLAGFGGSQDHTGPPLIEDYVRDVEALLGALGVGRVVIGGQSMGGYTAFAYHRVAPERLRGLVLADTRSGADGPAAREVRAHLLGIAEAGGARAIADEMLPKLVGATTHRTRPAVVAEVRALIEANGAEGIRRALVRMRDRPDSTPQLPHVPVPALVIVGEEDPIAPLEEARALSGALPDATLAILPAAGHLSNLENPDSFNAALRPWLTGL